MGAGMLTRGALARPSSGAFASVLGRGIAHLTIFLPALALYFIVLPRVYGFSALGQPAVNVRARLAVRAGDQLPGPGDRRLVQASGHPDADLPRHQPAAVLPSRILLAARNHPRTGTGGRCRLPADLAIDGIVRINQMGARLWELARDWRGLWGLAVISFALAVISAFSSSGGRCMANGRAQAIFVDRPDGRGGRRRRLLSVRGRGSRCRSPASCARPRSAWRPRSAVSWRRSRSRRVTACRAGDVVAELSALELTAGRPGARGARRRQGGPQQRLCGGARGGDRLARGRDRQGEGATGICGAAARPHRISGAQRLPPRSRRSTRLQNDAASRACRRRRGASQHDAAVAGPTREERAIADAQVQAAATALAILERRIDKTMLRAPADGMVSVIVAEVGEDIHAGQPVLAIEATGKRWLSFNAREDRLHGLTVGAKVDVERAGAARADAGTRHRARAARGIRDLAGGARNRRHDRSTLRLRLDRRGMPAGFRSRHDGLAQSLSGRCPL